MKKRILSALLSATLVVASVSSITAMAAGDTVNGTAYEQNTFTANEITHPENDLKAPDGIVDYDINSDGKVDVADITAHQIYLAENNN